VADQEALDAVPPPDPVDAAAELDRQSVRVISALGGRYWGGVRRGGVIGTGIAFIVLGISLIMRPTLIGLAVMLAFGAILIANIAVLKRSLRSDLRVQKPKP
jgi:hypothetical protein